MLRAPPTHLSPTPQPLATTDLFIGIVLKSIFNFCNNLLYICKYIQCASVREGAISHLLHGHSLQPCVFLLLLSTSGIFSMSSVIQLHFIFPASFRPCSLFLRILSYRWYEAWEWELLSNTSVWFWCRWLTIHCSGDIVFMLESWDAARLRSQRGHGWAWGSPSLGNIIIT